LFGAAHSYLYTTTVFSLLFMLVDTATVQWQKNCIFFTLVAMLCGLSMVEAPSLKLLPLWALVGALVGYALLILYKQVMRYNYALIPFAAGSYVALLYIQQGIFNAYPYAWLAAVINVCTVGALSLLWYWCVSKE
jgi:hypothetical protein